ncbi:unnamed protein product [Calicophoron daubneyi]|uniref:Chitobiosyldiphosphodolichol beta-mannosyltransferase n=1 Tax=Calicophoron daubneyi TaxID=300641 RepID=A0AAV2TUY8_CALDB
MKRLTAHVIVLGSLTQSPRILFHARCLARVGYSVTVSGYQASDAEKEPENSDLRFLNIPSPPDFKRFVFFTLLSSFLKLVFLSLVLLLHLIRQCRSRVILLQNPPAVPTFVVAWLFIRLTRKELIVDWHNYGFTLVELSTSRGSLLSRIYRLLEVNFASKFLSSSTLTSPRVIHLCVSRALQQDMLSRGIEATVFYDRAPDEFQCTSAEAAHSLLLKLSAIYPQLADPGRSKRRTRLTEITALPVEHRGSTPGWRLDRPAFVVSSCSWTADDDFYMMVDALDMYNNRACLPDSKLPPVLFAVTGRGPMKEFYANLIKSKRWTHVEVIMPWLDWSDYPVFLGCADIGISLHHSSSGLDLPMKVVDLLGVCVPVLALTYPTLNELLPPDRFGAHFRDAEELADQLSRLLIPQKTDNPGSYCDYGRFGAVGSQQLRDYRKNLEQYAKDTPRGYEYWKLVALPIFHANSE